MSNSLLGSILGFVAIVLALITHMIIKSLTNEVDFLMTVFGRFAFSLPLLFLFAFLVRKRKIFAVNNWFNIFLRSFFGIITMVPVFLSIQLIPIGLVTALAQSSAIFVTLLAPFFVGEKIGLIRWTAVLVGLFGVYLMTDPLAILFGTSNLSSLGLALATSSAITHAGLALTLRKLGQTEHPTTTALIHNLITTFIIFVSILFYGTSFIGTKGLYGIDIIFYPNFYLYILILLGVIGSFVQYLMATSYKYTDATVLVTIRYLAIPLAAIFGYIIWQEIPTSNQIIGALFIIFSSIIITVREIKLNKSKSFQIKNEI